jgi:hypothetical protein
MAYPTDVSKPKFGFDAFAENDPESQLAQAAFLLLLGRELGRRPARTRLGHRSADTRVTKGRTKTRSGTKTLSSLAFPASSEQGSGFGFETHRGLALPSRRKGSSRVHDFGEMTRDCARRLQETHKTRLPLRCCTFARSGRSRS